MADQAKYNAAKAALDIVEPGMRLGLGTGSTAAIFVDLLADRVRDGLDIVGVPTSKATEDQARRGGIALTTLDETPVLDVCIDGADEVDPNKYLIKGGGGALLREKIVAQASAQMIVIADQSKAVDVLGQFPLPVEVVPFGEAATVNAIQVAAERGGTDGEIVKRVRDGSPFITDNGLTIYDCHFGAIPDPPKLAANLLAIAGVAEQGLFIDLATTVIIGKPGGIDIIN